MIDQLIAWREHFLPGPALDIGAGNGDISLWLTQHGFPVDALEPDLAQAERLKSQLDQNTIQLHILDVLEFPFPSDHYSLIVASAVLHFIDQADLPSLSKRIMNSLIPGGMFFAAAFTRDDPAAKEAPVPGATPVHHFFGRHELRRLFQPLDSLFYEESRRSAPDSHFGYRAGATLIARRPQSP